MTLGIIFIAITAIMVLCAGVYLIYLLDGAGVLDKNAERFLNLLEKDNIADKFE